MSSISMESDLVQGAVRALPYAAAAVLAYHIYSGRSTALLTDPLVIESPIERVTSLSKSEQDKLPYPPDALPGKRDIDTPYGSIRAYEWGPEDGQKVLLVHGISTPCVSIAGVASRLAKDGHRVLIFDLFGRGYSGTPDPDTNPQNVQLFCSQIHFVLASSPLAWTGTSKFHLVGYSLGGAISVGFAQHFPELIDSLVLIAPAGLIRSSRLAFPSRLLARGAIPGPVVRRLVRRRFDKGGVVRKSANPEATPAKVATAEVPDSDSRTHPALAADSAASLFPDRPGISVADAVAWQVDYNKGFIPAFISSLQHIPVASQHSHWAVLGRRLETQRADVKDQAAARQGVRHGKVLMIMGKKDEVIVGDEVVPDAIKILGEDGVEVSWVDAAHDLPVVKPDQIARTMTEFWRE